MNQINFLPQTMITARGRQARVWRETVLIAAVALLIVAWHVSTRGRLASLEELVADNRQQAAAVADQAVEKARLENQYLALDRQVRLERQLTLPVNHSTLVAAIAQAMPAPVALTGLCVTAPAPRPGDPAEASSGGTSGGEGVMQVQITAIAPNDLQIADFVGRLADQPLFSNVKMIFSRAIDLGQVSGREFRLEMEVRLDRPYRPRLAVVEGGGDAR